MPNSRPSPRGSAACLPDDLPTAEGALAEPVAVGLHAVMRSGLKPGDRVLVLGAGPIGLLVAFWARRLGARDVVVADLDRHQEAARRRHRRHRLRAVRTRSRGRVPRR